MGDWPDLCEGKALKVGNFIREIKIGKSIKN